MLTAAVLLLALAAPARADKTDVVHFENGDRLTGEIKGLERGKLSFKTDATGTIQIEWEDVERISSSEHFDVELKSGERFFGSLAATAKGKVEVVKAEAAPTRGLLEAGQRLLESAVAPEKDEEVEAAAEQAPRVLALASIVRLSPIEDSFWQRVEGHLDLGFSFTQADDRTQVSFGGEASHRTLKYLRKLSFNSVQATQEEVDETNRHDLTFSVTRFLGHPKRIWLGFATLQHNDELGIDLRALLGAAAGWQLIQNNTERLTVLAGAAVTREELDGGSPGQNRAEGILGLRFESFKFDTPERDVDVGLLVFPSFNQSGRVRAELDASVRWEIVEDFFLGLTLLESYDSDPPTEEAATNDLSLITSLGWSF